MPEGYKGPKDPQRLSAEPAEPDYLMAAQKGGFKGGMVGGLIGSIIAVIVCFICHYMLGR